MEKICRKFAPTASPRTLFKFWLAVRTCQCMQETLLEVRYVEKKKKKKKVNLILLCTQSLFMDKIMNNKRGLGLVTSLSLGCKTCVERVHI